MNKFKTLLLGTAAATIAATGAAQAADAPMREPVYRCDARGFIELPGTDVCFKVGGFARLIVWGANEDAGSQETVAGGDDFGMYGQGRLNFDARRSTDHGTVRAFIEVQATDNNSNTGGALQLRHAFAQLGNWVFGKTWSTYLHGASDPNGTDLSFLAHTIRINQIRYTQSVGNGLTVSVALEDSAYEDLTGSGTAGAQGENNVPNVVANINYAQGGWDAQLSGAVLFNEFGAGVDNTGYGIMFALAGEITDSVNVFGKINYTDDAPGYQFDWVSLARRQDGPGQEVFAFMGGLSFEATDDVTVQLVGGWADVDSPVAAQDGEQMVAGALAQWRVASGFDIIGEVFYRGTDFDLPIADTDEVVGVLQFRAGI
ncbi:porin [Tepidamorphus sp. 3E244]|uniref:porin n=1 Tax=Tepidamorphus sp. 3E244 TaxID=3385498 RepID=UPI0038FC650D